MSIAIVDSAITPYTNRLFDSYALSHSANLHVFQCSAREPIRKWTIPQPSNYRLTTLSGIALLLGDVNNIYFNPQIITELSRLAPEMIVIGGFTPTMVMSGLYALARGLPLGIYFDGSRATDKGESSRLHGILRRFFIPRATFGICPSEGNRELLAFWGMERARTAITPFPSGWDPPAVVPDFHDRPFDLLFSGSLTDRKNPLFFARVVEQIIAKGLRPRVRIVGHGPMRGKLEEFLKTCGADAHFDGYLQQHGLAEAYCSARVVLFPTQLDAWELVADEFALCGTPIVSSPHAVSSIELVERYGIGLVRSLDVEAWSDAVIDMLSSETRWLSFMSRRQAVIDAFSLDRAVAGFSSGIALGRTLPPPSRHGQVSKLLASE